MTIENPVANQQQSSAVNLYILPDSDLDKRLGFVVRLAEKAMQKQPPVLIIAADEQQLKALDKLIWTSKPTSFIAHEIIDAELSEPLPNILLTDDVGKLQNIDFSPQTVIDLSYEATPLVFPKIMLVANQHEEILSNARMKYKSYSSSGNKPTVHKL